MSDPLVQQPAGPESQLEGGEPPTASTKKGLHLSWVWLLPLMALGLVVYLGYVLLAERGPLISITFETADGLSAHQTTVKYKAVTLGTVQDIELSEELSHVVVKVRMTDDAESLLTENARFWVVRPRLESGLSAVQTGLETLVSGAYVALDPGSRPGKPRRHFEGLEKPPSVRSDEPGTVYFLEADGLGSLGPGSPIFHRDVEVGEVLSYELGHDSRKVTIRVFVRAPHDERVQPQSRFWNASGLRVSTGADGIRFEIESVRSLLSGGIAFHTPTTEQEGAQSRPESTFQLHGDRSAAETQFYAENIPYVSYFHGSARGLQPGTEVHMFGMSVGSVTHVELVQDPRPEHAGKLAVRVSYVLQPERALHHESEQALEPAVIRSLVEQQLRVVLKTSNLFMGQKMLSLEYVPGAESAPAAMAREGDAVVLPSSTQGLDELTTSLGQVAAQVERIPFESIGANLNRTLSAVESTVSNPDLQRALASLDETLGELRSLAQKANEGLGPALLRLPDILAKLEHAVEQANSTFGQGGYGKDSTLQRNLERMLSQVADAARSIRLLTDYLNRHPEAVLRGREEGEQ